MPGPIDLLPETDSLLSRVDPRWKLAAILLAIVGISALRGPAAAALALLGAVMLAWLGRLPWRWCLVRLGTMLIMVAPFMLLLPFLSPEGPQPGIHAALTLGFKAASVVLLILVILATAPLSDTLKAAQSLRIPGLLIQLGMLTYRYIFVLAGELGRLRTAVRVRGYRNRPGLHSYRTIGNLSGTLLVRGYEQAERVGQAMRCRGFDGRFRSLHTFRTRPADVAVFVAIVAATLALVVGERYFS
jgi:cobalt/nickel transport system permease protein